MNAPIDRGAERVSEELRQRRREYLPHLFPAGRIRGSTFFIGDVHGNPGESLPVPLDGKQKTLRDFADGFSGDDLDLWAAVRCNGDLGQAMREAQSWLGLPGDNHASITFKERSEQNSTNKSGDSAKPVESLGGSTAPPAKHPHLGAPSLVHEYTDAAGKVVFYVCRFDKPDGDKEFRPLSLRNGRWQWKDPDGPLPLYRLAGLVAHRNKPLLIVEGEKAVEVAEHLFDDYAVITWAHGAHAVTKTDWAPLKGRGAVLWPDNDGEGRQAMQDVADACRAAGARLVQLVQVPKETAPKWDLGNLGDPTKQGPDFDQTVQLLAEAPLARDCRLAGLGLVSAVDLLARDLPEPKFVVPGYITEGACILGGKPKIGKSWLALNIANAVATGGQALGSIPVEPGDALYLALEDNERRLHGRLKAVLQGDSPSPRLHFACSWRRLDEGGLDDLRLWLEAQSEARIVIIDTLAKVRGRPRRDAGIYADDYETITGLKALADEFELAILMVHHLRKAAADDPLDEVSGSTGLTGAADSVLVLRRENARANAILHVIGRDVEESQTALQFDGNTGAWTLLGSAEDYRRSQARMEIVRLLTSGDVPMTPKEIAKALGKNYNTVKGLLRKMHEAGEVDCDGEGRYTVPPP